MPSNKSVAVFSGDDKRHYHNFVALSHAEQIFGESEDGYVVFGSKMQGSWRSVYFGSTLIDPIVLRGIARLAGVHLCSQVDDAVYINKHFVAVHTREGGKRVIELPRRSDVFDLWNKRWVAENTDRITFEAEPLTTYMFAIGERPAIATEWEHASAKFAQQQGRRRQLLQEIRTASIPSVRANSVDGYVRDFLFLGPYNIDRIMPMNSMVQVVDILPGDVAKNSYHPVADDAVEFNKESSSWRHMAMVSRQHYGADLGILTSGASVFYIYTTVELDRDMNLRADCTQMTGVSYGSVTRLYDRHMVCAQKSSVCLFAEVWCRSS